ncbi:hypothetical protein MtrunA17_Chr2g0292121 [Medicago truncatula]|uniref:Transmembrane protein n=1 Tax=Medicago truncatula TaxID=3880 RepID=A0A396J8C3_MEDTR|nr:hypothetical protein MtrunA17_Chr2g0292121 [Medicago truncatula]
MPRSNSEDFLLIKLHCFLISPFFPLLTMLMVSAPGVENNSWSL